MTSEIQSYNFRGVALRTPTDETGKLRPIAKNVYDILPKAIQEQTAPANAFPEAVLPSPSGHAKRCNDLIICSF